MGLFNIFKKNTTASTVNETKTESVYTSEEYLDDITFIKEMKHISSGPWHQYDVLLAARSYGWEAMIAWADYISVADLENISEVTIAPLGGNANDITQQYHENGSKFSGLSEITVEESVLSIAGISKTLKAPMKIVWFNQTQILRFFTIIDNKDLVKKYVETVIRRTFGIENEMKLGKPIPEE